MNERENEPDRSEQGGTARDGEAPRAGPAVPEDAGHHAFFALQGPLEGFEAEPATPVEEATALLARLGPSPAWTVPAQFRRVLEPAYRRASRAAARLGRASGSEGPAPGEEEASRSDSVT